MSFTCSQEHIEEISRVLGAEAKNYGNHFRYEIDGESPQHKLALEIYPHIPIGESEGALVTVYTPNSIIQLQHCSGMIASELMGEVTFVAESGGKVSGVIVEKGGGCSVYSNVDRSLLSGDFSKLGPEVMLSGIALSLTELILPGESEE